MGLVGTSKQDVMSHAIC